MGLCKTCKKVVSDNAKSCPHCGEPWPTRNFLNKPLPVTGCFFVTFLVLGILVLLGVLLRCC